MSTRRATGAPSAQLSNVSLARQQLADCAAVARALDMKERAARLSTAAPYPKTAGTAMEQANDPLLDQANQARSEIKQLLYDPSLSAASQDIPWYQQMDLMLQIEPVVNKFLGAIPDTPSKILFLNTVFNQAPTLQQWARERDLPYLAELISVRADQYAAAQMRIVAGR
jgi:hypothetical protein